MHQDDKSVWHAAAIDQDGDTVTTICGKQVTRSDDEFPPPGAVGCMACLSQVVVRLNETQDMYADMVDRAGDIARVLGRPGPALDDVMSGPDEQSQRRPG